MKHVPPMLVAIVVAGCAVTEPASHGVAAATSASTGPSTARTVAVKETTVATIDGWKITVGNIMVDAWTRPDGTAARGPTAAIGVYDEKKSERSKQTAGEGAILDIHGRRWRLDAVRMPKAGNGSVQLVEIGP